MDNLMDFRVWNTTSKEFTFFDTPEIQFRSKRKVTIGFRNVEAEKFMFCGYCGIEPYIGIKDNKRTEEYPEGQKIYAGDLVVCDDGGDYFPEFDDEEREVYEVYYADHAGYWLRNKNGPIELEFSPFNYARITVIGNIHENPELLEVESDEA